MQFTVEYNILHTMYLGIDTGVETPSEVHHSHGHSWCYLLDFFPNRRLQLNQITWTIFAYLLLLSSGPKGINRTAQDRVTVRAKGYRLDER